MLCPVKMSGLDKAPLWDGGGPWATGWASLDLIILAVERSTVHKVESSR